jgi:hypothetical protein
VRNSFAPPSIRSQEEQSWPPQQSSESTAPKPRSKTATPATGFRNTDSSVLVPENAGTKDFAIERGTKAPEGTTTGAGTGGVIGGLNGALIGMGAPEYEAKRYEGRVRQGGILLSVHSDSSDWTSKAK